MNAGRLEVLQLVPASRMIEGERSEVECDGSTISGRRLTMQRDEGGAGCRSDKGADTHSSRPRQVEQWRDKMYKSIYNNNPGGQAPLSVASS